MATSNRLTAIGSDRRIAALDAWRGFALLGVCIVNFVLTNDDYLADRIADSLATAPFDWRMEALVSFFLRNKAHTIFSFLFGIGLAMIAQRAEHAGESSGNVLLRRLVLLLVFGWAHCLLLYHGDILHRYALLGLVTVAMARVMRPGAMAVVGIVLAVCARLVYEEGAFLLSLLDVSPRSVQLPLPSLVATNVDTASPGGLAAFLQANVSTVLDELRNLPKLLFVDLYYLGRILLGYACWRSGLLAKLLASGSGLHWRLGTGLVVASLILTALRQFLPGAVAGEAWHAANNLLRHIDIILLSAAYLAIVAAMVANVRLAWLMALFTQVGRMSLTNYVLQSVGMLLLFAPVGFGLGGRVGATVAVALAVGFFGLQVAISRSWLARHSQGPLERLWRRLVYGRPPTARAAEGEPPDRQPDRM